MEEHAYVVNVEGAVVRDGEYLLVERAPEEDHAAGTLAFPGGKVEQAPPGDAPVEATVRRELSEEVGIEVGAVEYSHSRTFETDTGVQCLNIVTRCRYESGTATPREPEEVAAVHWLGAEELGSRDGVPGFLRRDVERLEGQRTAVDR